MLKIKELVGWNIVVGSKTFRICHKSAYIQTNTHTYTCSTKILPPYYYFGQIDHFPLRFCCPWYSCMLRGSGESCSNISFVISWRTFVEHDNNTSFWLPKAFCLSYTVLDYLSSIRCDWLLSASAALVSPPFSWVAEQGCSYNAFWKNH